MLLYSSIEDAFCFCQKKKTFMKIVLAILLRCYGVFAIQFNFDCSAKQRFLFFCYKDSCRQSAVVCVYGKRQSTNVAWFVIVVSADNVSIFLLVYIFFVSLFLVHSGSRMETINVYHVLLKISLCECAIFSRSFFKFAYDFE